MRQRFFFLFLLILPVLFTRQHVHAENGVSGGLNLLQPTSARASGLGEAFVAVDDDIAAFGYNPASLSSLKRGHASFQYYKGVFEDSFGQFIIGSPTMKGGIGLSIGFYDGGKIDLFNGVTAKSVTAKSDLMASAGFSRTMGSLSAGVAAKYISSKLGETASANAVAVDVGMAMPLSNNARLGIAAQNFGSKLAYDKEGDNLPRLLRMGVGTNVMAGRVPVTLLLEAPYYLNEKEVRPAVGIEANVGPLALRAGYKSVSDLGGVSLGAGFQHSSFSLDYSFSLIDKLDSQHRVSFSMAFGKPDKKTTPPPGKPRPTSVTFGSSKNKNSAPKKTIPQKKALSGSRKKTEAK